MTKKLKDTLCLHGNHTKCRERREEFELPDFKGICCANKDCMRVLSYEKLVIAKAKPEKPKAEKPKAVQENKPVEQAFSEVKQAELTVVEPFSIDPKTPVAKEISFMDDLEKMEQEGAGVSTMLNHLIKEYGLSSKQAVEAFKEWRQSKAAEKKVEKAPDFVPELPPVEEFPDPGFFVEPETLPEAEGLQPMEEVEQEIKGPMIPSPLPEKEAKEYRQAEIKPPLPSVTPIEMTFKEFPIVKVDFFDELKSYRFELVDEEGIVFHLNVTPTAEKYQIGKAKPELFYNANIKLKFDKVDESGVPVEPVVEGLVPKKQH